MHYKKPRQYDYCPRNGALGFHGPAWGASSGFSQPPPSSWPTCIVRDQSRAGGTEWGGAHPWHLPDRAEGRGGLDSERLVSRPET